MSLAADDRKINERSSGIYSAQLKDENDDAVALAAIGTLTLTLYDKASGDIINSRNAVNALNANDVTVSSTGALTWKMGAADNQIVSSGLPIGRYERHIALFQWTYDISGSGAGAGKHEVIIDVLNLGKVT